MVETIAWSTSLIPIIGIIYDDSDPISYKGVDLHIGEERETFYSGDPTVDYLTAGFVAHYRAGPAAHIMCSSSVDHFVMDGGELEDDDPPEEKIKRAVALGKAYLEERGEAPPKKST